MHIDDVSAQEVQRATTCIHLLECAGGGPTTRQSITHRRAPGSTYPKLSDVQADTRPDMEPRAPWRARLRDRARIQVQHSVDTDLWHYCVTANAGELLCSSSRACASGGSARWTPGLRGSALWTLGLKPLAPSLWSCGRRGVLLRRLTRGGGGERSEDGISPCQNGAMISTLL